LSLAAKKTVEVEFPTRILTSGYTADLKGWTIELERALRNVDLDLTSPTIPFGMLDAKVGIVFDQLYEPKAGESTGLPYGIVESGFNETNVLAWSWSLRKYTDIDACRPVQSLPGAECVILKQHTKSSISRSQLRVTIVCGGNASEIVFEGESNIH
jgi:hypothetical protein